MFEYLMPLLLMRSYPATLLDESCRAAVRRHVDYATALGIDPEVLMRRPSAALVWLAEHHAERLDALELPPGRQGEQNGTSHLSSKGSRDCRIARQHNKWSYMLGVSATAA